LPTFVFVNQHVQLRVHLRKCFRCCRNARRVFKIQLDRIHAGIGLRHVGEFFLAPPRDDDLIACCMQRLCKTAPNAAAAACNKNRVARNFHAGRMHGRSAAAKTSRPRRHFACAAP
jgi:hypothetical protein